jgi:hypothetical protein
MKALIILTLFYTATFHHNCWSLPIKTLPKASSKVKTFMQNHPRLTKIAKIVAPLGTLIASAGVLFYVRRKPACDANADTNTNADADTNTNADADTNTNADANTNTNADANTNADTDADADTDEEGTNDQFFDAVDNSVNLSAK